MPDQIDSSKIEQPKNPITGADENNDLDELVEDIMENFGLALQIIEDFSAGKIVPEIDLTED